MYVHTTYVRMLQYVCLGTHICDDSFLATTYVFTRLYVKPKLALKIQTACA